ncbi:hypothetical protein Vretimale_4827 [Volvox reticuliferus]|uniref:Uncharacterized protein n=1 Tax=Volvox reticuliferus TaxID=1737510 RepID=A0A8J4G2S6_9CHLO|nr:hypothetical protein Vretimale_4827 [Volvox reticuliferus]
MSKLALLQGWLDGPSRGIVPVARNSSTCATLSKPLINAAMLSYADSSSASASPAPSMSSPLGLRPHAPEVSISSRHTCRRTSPATPLPDLPSPFAWPTTPLPL